MVPIVRHPLIRQAFTSRPTGCSTRSSGFCCHPREARPAGRSAEHPPAYAGHAGQPAAGIRALSCKRTSKAASGHQPCISQQAVQGDSAAAVCRQQLLLLVAKLQPLGADNFKTSFAGLPELADCLQVSQAGLTTHLATATAQVEVSEHPSMSPSVSCVLAPSTLASAN